MDLNCGFLGIILFMFMVFWVVSTITRLPTDISEIVINYQKKDWPELQVSAKVTAIYWSLTLLFLWFFYAAFTLPQKEYG
jgi:hypothetical protein